MSKSNKIYNKNQGKIEKSPAESKQLPAAFSGLSDETKNALESIMSAKSSIELTQGVALFNVAQKKVHATREIEINNLIDLILKQAIKRFTNRPDEFSNQDLLAYLNTVMAQLERTHKFVTEVDETPAIQVTNQRTNVNVNILPGGVSSQASKDRILDAVNAIIKAASQAPINEQTVVKSDTNIVDVKEVAAVDSNK